MTYEEAKTWLKGERSMCNIIPDYPPETWQVRIAQADAAMTQQILLKRLYGQTFAPVVYQLQVTLHV